MPEPEQDIVSAATRAWGVAVDSETAREMMALKGPHREQPTEIPDETPGDRIAAALIESVGDTRAYVRLAKMEKGKAAQWCADYSPVEYEEGGLEMIRSTWGAGEYDVRLYGCMPDSGYFGVRAKGIIAIAAIPGQSNNRSSDEISPGLRAILETLASNQQKLAETLAAKPEIPQTSPMEMMMQMLTLQKAMADAMPKPAQAGGISETIKALRELREASAELIPEKEGAGENPMRMLGTIVDMVKSAQQSPQQQNIPVLTMPQNLRAEPQTQQLQQQPQQQTKLETVSDQQTQMNELQNLIAPLFSMAQRNAPVPEAAQYAADNLPDEFIDLLEMPGWIEPFLNIAPMFAPHRDWLIAVGAATLPLCYEEDTPSTAPISPVASPASS